MTMAMVIRYNGSGVDLGKGPAVKICARNTDIRGAGPAKTQPFQDSKASDFGAAVIG